jgi:hypothetical protein
MAIVALILCCVIFFPLAPIIGIGLAVAVLVRSRRGRNYGVKKAIAGIAIGVSGLAIVVWLVVGVWWFASGANVERDSIGAVTSNGTAHPARLHLGDCYSDAQPGSISAVLGVVDVVPCSAGHQWEIYQISPLLPGADWPGQTEVDQRANDTCRAAFDRLTVENDDAYSLMMFHYPPTESDWNAGYQRVICVAGNVHPSEGSIAD